MGKVSKFDQNINAPVIAGVEINTDEHGRFSLNALHKASGGEAKNGPSHWLANQKTQDLVQELKTQTTENPVVKKEGRNGGTFAHEILAVEYAGWVSPAFRIKVNQAFIDSRKGEAFHAQPVSQDKLSREVRLQMREFGKFGKLMGLEGNQLALSVSRSVEAVTGVSPMGVMGITHIPSDLEAEAVNVTDLGRLIGLSSQAMNIKLISEGLQTSYRNSKGKLCYELTDEGKAAGGRWHDAQKAQGGRPIMQILWPTSVADLFKKGGAA
jgi:hypothetical protein